MYVKQYINFLVKRPARNNKEKKTKLVKRPTFAVMERDLPYIYYL